MQHPTRYPQMGYVGSSSATAGGGGGGLSRFKSRSAPVSWFDNILLEPSDDEVALVNQMPPHPYPNTNTQCAAQVANLANLGAVYNPTPLFHTSASSSTFTRQNNSQPPLLASLPSDDLLSFLDVPTTPRPFLDVQTTPRLDPTQQTLLKGERSDSFSDMDMEKLFKDSVPCSVRAKRGFATHPRSIAERVRRTKISDRIRKLQELVPNMDKQTNTSDMLDEAVKYVKFLQRQNEELVELQKNCTCSRNG